MVSCVIRSSISTFFSTGTVEKKLTKDGKDRQLRIVDKLFHERKLAKLIMGLYSSVFPLLKSFDTFRDEGTSNSLVTRRSGNL